MVEEDAENTQLTNKAEHSQRQAQLKTLPNSYGLRGRVEPEQFIVPEGLVTKITEFLVKKQSISIIGARMMGKTSLLNFLASPLCQSYYQNASDSLPILHFTAIDLQEHSDKNRDQLMVELAYTISSFAGNHFTGITYKEALDKIKSIIGRRSAGGPLWILCFDEFDQVAELNGINKAFFDDLRSLSQNYNLCYVVGSRCKLCDLPLPQAIKSSSFFNIFKECYLTVWDKTTAEKLMFKPQGKELEVFNVADSTSITLLTGRHPQLLQIACYYLFDAYRASGKEPGKFEQILESYAQDAEVVYSTYWEQEIDKIEQSWIIEAWHAWFGRDKEKLQMLSLGHKNRAIRAKLASLGLILLSESERAEDTLIPKGFGDFLVDKIKIL